MRKLLYAIFIIVFCLQATSCTISNTSYPTSGPTLSELDISEEFTATAKVQKIIGVDWSRLVNSVNTSIGLPQGSLDGDLENAADALMAQEMEAKDFLKIIGSFSIKSSTYTYALQKLIAENPGYDVVISPKFDARVNGIPGIYVTETVTIKARLGKIKAELLN